MSRQQVVYIGSALKYKRQGQYYLEHKIKFPKISEIFEHNLIFFLNKRLDVQIDFGERGGIQMKAYPREVGFLNFTRFRLGHFPSSRFNFRHNLLNSS